MSKILDDLLHAGVGLTQVTKENVEKIFNELKKRGEVYEEERDHFIRKTLDRLEKSGKEITDKVKDKLLPNAKRVEELNEKIDTLIKELEELKKKKS
jgi:polyhydroxyalkanoate synthesis regulator phasin